jgi:GNAT superfamily N-acetyltransferase
MIMERYVSGLDTERFGVKIARISEFGEPVAGMMKKLRGIGVKMAIARAKCSEPALINELEDNGFRIKDTQVTYRREISRGIGINSVVPDGFVIRESVENDAVQAAVIAGEAFNNYGHYMADARLDREKCGQIYPDWARRSCLDRGIADIVFVAEAGGRIAGFATYKIRKGAAGEYAACGLGAVAREYRGIGVYPAIIYRALEWGAQKGLVWEEYSCLADNFSAGRAYTGAGFKPADAFVTMHCWLD